MSFPVMRPLAVALLGSLALVALPAQEYQDRGRLGLARTWYALSPSNGTGTGASLVLQPRLRGPVFLDLAFSGLLDSGGDYPLHGALLEGGVNLSRRWRRLTLGGGLGLAGMIAGDDDGTSRGGAGPYAAGQITLWPSRYIGVTGRWTFYALPRGLARRGAMLGLAFGW